MKAYLHRHLEREFMRSCTTRCVHKCALRTVWFVHLLVELHLLVPPGEVQISNKKYHATLFSFSYYTL